MTGLMSDFEFGEDADESESTGSTESLWFEDSARDEDGCRITGWTRAVGSALYLLARRPRSQVGLPIRPVDPFLSEELVVQDRVNDHRGQLDVLQKVGDLSRLENHPSLRGWTVGALIARLRRALGPLVCREEFEVQRFDLVLLDQLQLGRELQVSAGGGHGT